jgi:ADP-heptose:LPS heptosyltransferase/glycosyltransferase involved in cell wall biosynthesis
VRIVIDMQGAQTGSWLRGIGRYTVALARALVRNRGEHEILLALNGAFPDMVRALRQTFQDLVSPDHIRVWQTIGPTRAEDPENLWRRSVSERIRETFLESLQPDVVLVSSHFEGLGDDAVDSIGVLSEAVPVAVILYDLIPLLSPSPIHEQTPFREWYRAKLGSLKSAAMLLAISESARGEAIRALDWNADRVVTISGACDDAFRLRRLTSVEHQALMARTGIEKPFVMYAGGPDATKNLPRLISAFAQLPIALREAHQLVLVGEMPEKSVQLFRQCAVDSGLHEVEMVLTGYVQDADLIGLYSSCALFVFPSLHEGLGLPPLEAMACGAVVIGADATSLREVIALPEARFDPMSSSAIAEKITAGLTDGDFRSRQRAHAQVQLSRFSWDQTAHRTLSALQTCRDQYRARISPLLNLIDTGVYRRRELTILVIKLDHLGDFLLSIPALTKLRAKYPYASIDAIVGSWNVPAAQSLGVFREVYSYDFFKQKASDSPSIKDDILTALVEGLPHYNIAIDLRRPPESRFLLDRINADLKVGYQTFDPEADRCMQIALPVYRERPFVTTPLNTISQGRQMVALIDALPEDPNDFVSLPLLGNPAEREAGTIAVFPRAGKRVREWSAQNFQELIDLLTQNAQVQRVNVYLANGQEAGEVGVVERDKLRIHVGLSFSELVRSLSANALCVANNSGGAHLASYLGVSVIAIFSGHELPSEWAPAYHDSYVLHRGAECAPCHLGQAWHCPNGMFCLNDIAVYDVYAKVVEALARIDLGSGMSGQLNEDALVKRLLNSIAALGPIDDESMLRTLATSIGRNHPTYTMNPDVAGVYPNQVIDHHSSRIDWQGFSNSEQQFRWTDSTSAKIVFAYHGPDRAAGHRTLKLHIRTLGRQRVIARLNGTQVCDAVYWGRHKKLLICGNNLKFGANTLEFELPDARVPGRGDTRRLAIAIRSLTIQMRDPAVLERAGI